MLRYYYQILYLERNLRNNTILVWYVGEYVMTNNKPFVIMPDIMYVLRDELNWDKVLQNFKISQFATFWGFFSSL